MFKVLRTGKRKKKEWKRMVTKVGWGGVGVVVVVVVGRGLVAGTARVGWPISETELQVPARAALAENVPALQQPPHLGQRLAAWAPQHSALLLRHRPTRPRPAPAPLPPAQVTFVPPGFTRKPPKYERFIRPTGLRMSKAHVTHPELKATFQLEIIGVKKNPNGQAYTGLGVVTKGEPGGGRRGRWRAPWASPPAAAGLRGAVGMGGARPFLLGC